MEMEMSLKLPVMPNSNFVALPDLMMDILATNEYDVRLFRSLKIGDELIISYAHQDHVYNDFDNMVLPGVETVGTICRIVSLKELPDRILVQVFGKKRATLSDFVRDEDKKIVYATHSNVSISGIDSAQIYAATADFINLYNRFRTRFPLFPDCPDFSKQASIPEYIPYHIAAFLDSPDRVCQEILEDPNPLGQIKTLSKDMLNSSADASINYELQEQLSRAVDRNQREYILREKMKIVKDQLKEFDGTDSEERYINAIKNRPDDFPENIRKRVEAEYNRLKTMPAASQEATVITAYLDTLVSLPWYRQTVDNDNLVQVKHILDKNHYGLTKQKDRILEYLAVKQLTRSLKAPILCFYGAPGVGKTSLAISIAEALGRRFVKMALGGISDEAEIRGHRKTYVGAMPGKIISQIKKAQVNNPVFLLDEIDKVTTGGFHGDPASALLEVLDPEQNKTFMDNYLDEPFDLSHVLFICTANDVSKIPAPLFDRLEMIELNTYTKFEKINIAKEYLIPDEEKENGIKPGQMTWTDDALDYIIEYYTREAGVREFRRRISTIDRKFAVEYLNDEKHNGHVVIDVERVKKYLGAEIFTHDKELSESQVGIINGLAYTEAGGEVLKIEANTFPGKGQLILTGNLGDVMKEACETALSFIRSIGDSIGIHPEFFANNDIHVHFPEGATPKDGPSAGVATALCILSAICNLRIRNDVAMTGEIDLRGNVMPIGGLREKCNAACREHLKTVFIPKENHKDAKELPKEIADSLNIVEVSQIQELFPKVFLDDIASLKKQIHERTSPKKASKKTKAN